MVIRSPIGPVTLIVFGAAILLIGAQGLLGAWICILWVAAFIFIVNTVCRWLADTSDDRQDLSPAPAPEADWFWEPERPANRPLFTIVDDEEETE